MSTSWTDFLVRTFTGGANEMTGDNLIRQVVDGIVALRTRGRRGVSHLPSEVEVTITVGGGEGSLGVVTSLVEDPSFEKEISQRLQNRLVDLPISAHPMRLYRVVAGRRHRVSVDEVTDPIALELLIEGGDRSGEALVVPTAQRDLRLGRSPNHGSDSEHNDLIVTQRDAFVSRRAARIRRLGGHLRIQSLDQGDALAVVRRSGERVRPNRTIERWAPVRPGDVIELNDGAEQSIRLLLRPVPRAEGARPALTADPHPAPHAGGDRPALTADPHPGPLAEGARPALTADPHPALTADPAADTLPPTPPAEAEAEAPADIPTRREPQPSFPAPTEEEIEIEFDDLDELAGSDPQSTIRVPAPQPADPSGTDEESP